MAKLTKTFITEFKKQLLSVHQEISNLSGDCESMYEVNDDIVFNGYVKKE